MKITQLSGPFGIFFIKCFLRYFHNLVLDSFLIIFGHLVWAILSTALVFTLLGLVRGRTLITMQLIILHFPHEMTLLQCYTLGLSTLHNSHHNSSLPTCHDVKISQCHTLKLSITSLVRGRTLVTTLHYLCVTMSQYHIVVM